MNVLAHGHICIFENFNLNFTNVNVICASDFVIPAHLHQYSLKKVRVHKSNCESPGQPALAGLLDSHSYEPD